uniref:Uncharacterized protein n=1 Tax=Cucumis melo TaxID=3656 RepID=A0A9I9E934_CUCME
MASGSSITSDDISDAMQDPINSSEPPTITIMLNDTSTNPPQASPICLKECIFQKDDGFFSMEGLLRELGFNLLGHLLKNSIPIIVHCRNHKKRCWCELLYKFGLRKYLGKILESEDELSEKSL